MLPSGFAERAFRDAGLKTLTAAPGPPASREGDLAPTTPVPSFDVGEPPEPVADRLDG